MGKGDVRLEVWYVVMAKCQGFRFGYSLALSVLARGEPVNGFV
jgi:hypothetical protein